MAVPTVIQPIDTNEIHLFGKQYWVDGTILKRRTTQVAPATRTGNPERADQQFASEVIWDDLTGGVGVINMDERETPDRFTYSSAETRVPKRVMMPPARRIVTVNGQSFDGTNFITGGVNYSSNDYIVGGTVVKQLDSTGTMRYYNDNTGVGGSWATSGGTEYSLPTVAYSKPILWKGNLWIPCTTQLIRYATGTTRFDNVTNGGANIAAYFLAIFDEDLLILTSNGTIFSTDDNTLTPTVTTRGVVDTFRALTGLTIHKNNLGEPAPIIGTDRGLLLHDYWTQKLYEMGITFYNGDADNCKGLTTWDGDLWFGKGGNAHQVTGGARVVRGPNLRDGLLKQYQGHVVELCPSLDNSLIGAIDSITAGQISSYMAYNRKGWHPIAEMPAFFHTTGAGDYYDTVTRADSTTTPGTSTSGHAWTERVGEWGVDTNKLYRVSTGGAFDLCTLTTTLSDCLVEALFTFAGAGVQITAKQQLVFRLSDSSNFLAVETVVDGSGFLYLKLVKVEAGTSTTLDTWYYAYEVASSTITAHCLADQIVIYVDGVPVMQQYSTFNQTAVIHGIGLLAAGTGAAARWDDIYINDDRSRAKLLHYSASSTPGKLYFNQGNRLGYVSLYDTTENQTQFITNDFERYATLLYPIFDAGLSEVQKTALSVQIRMLDTSAYEFATLWYTTDDGTTWTQMLDINGAAATVSSNGVTNLFFDTDRLGTLFYNVQFKIQLYARALGSSANQTRSPKVVFLKMRYLKQFDILYGYTVKLDLTRDQPDGNTSREAITNVESAIAGKLLGKFSYKDGDTRTVFIEQFAGPVGTGTEHDMRPTLTLLEIIKNGSI